MILLCDTSALVKLYIREAFSDDSIQLAAAHILSNASPEPVQFACFDRRLSNAARILSLEPPFAAGPS
ncbi:hypothetical protein CKO31_21450 [Thiohalocapsa halophila]|uniref:Type II toxin-antitoxin system VapC family toxin n=1 Tax=Thiohalocapsa halophila TaxID=69359 RepID=A0ABS1CMV3_9GAMM|nr:hypothetical protein [Thiohalocapsa halophila]MBK1633271.1 hypothetical protein [Thiohalocapsa halophila]